MNSKRNARFELEVVTGHLLANYVLFKYETRLKLLR